MAYRLPGGRVALAFEDDPFAGLRAEVESIGAWAVYRLALERINAFFAATDPAEEVTALSALYEFFVAEAQPTWEIIDHRGPVPASPAGMLRLPLRLSLRLVELWTETFAGAQEAEPASTAVDELYSPSPLRDQLNEVLARKQAEAA